MAEVSRRSWASARCCWSSAAPTRHDSEWAALQVLAADIEAGADRRRRHPRRRPAAGRRRAVRRRARRGARARRRDPGRRRSPALLGPAPRAPSRARRRADPAGLPRRARCWRPTPRAEADGLRRHRHRRLPRALRRRAAIAAVAGQRRQPQGDLPRGRRLLRRALVARAVSASRPSPLGGERLEHRDVVESSRPGAPRTARAPRAPRPLAQRGDQGGEVARSAVAARSSRAGDDRRPGARAASRPATRVSRSRVSPTSPSATLLDGVGDRAHADHDALVLDGVDQARRRGSGGVIGHSESCSTSGSPASTSAAHSVPRSTG